jgi:hypothetical protein
MENKMERIFRMGDEVYHHKFGWGKVMASTDRIVTVTFKDKYAELFGEDLELLSFSAYSVELIGFTQEQPEREITWTSIWEDYCDEGYIGASQFVVYLTERYKLPEKL